MVFLRDVLLEPFEVNGNVTIHIANVTVHPLYFPNLFPLLEDPIAELRELQRRDERFWRAAVRKADDLLNGGKQNANFMRAQRVAKHVLKRTDRAMLQQLRDYLRSVVI